MPTVSEILKQTGMSDEEIAKLDSKTITAFGGVLTAAEQRAQTAAAEGERAEIAKRANEQFYANQIALSLDNWANEKTNLEAQLAFLKAQTKAPAVLDLSRPTCLLNPVMVEVATCRMLLEVHPEVLPLLSSKFATVLAVPSAR